MPCVHSTCARKRRAYSCWDHQRHHPNLIGAVVRIADAVRLCLLLKCMCYKRYLSCGFRAWIDTSNLSHSCCNFSSLRHSFKLTLPEPRCIVRNKTATCNCQAVGSLSSSSTNSGALMSHSVNLNLQSYKTGSGCLLCLHVWRRVNPMIFGWFWESTVLDTRRQLSLRVIRIHSNQSTDLINHVYSLYFTYRLVFYLSFSTFL